MSPEVAKIVAMLNLDQKLSLLSGADDWHTTEIPEVGLPPVELGDGPHGLRTETGVDMVWIPSTCFPTASALGATWDPELVRRVGLALGEEARALGVDLLLGPGVNMKRTPLCGRNFEYFAEDPVLAGDLAAAYVQGLQSTGIGACLKHFAANNQETLRTEISVEADERTLREIYLEAFHRVIHTADPWAVMCSYNRIGGVHASQHHWLLTEVLRQEWGYPGLVVSDWDAVHDPVAAVSAGLDLEMPGTGGRSAFALRRGLAEGTLSEAAVDQAAARVIEFVRRCRPDGAPAHSPVRQAGIVPGAPLSEAHLAELGAETHHELAREVASAAITLLRNEDGVLPLDPDSDQRIAVVGGYARVPRIQGGGSAGVNPTRVDEPLAGLREFAGDRTAYAQGYPVPETDFYRELAPDLSDSDELREEAVRLAVESDLVLAFVGLPLSSEVEAADRTTLALPEDQVQLLTALADTGKPLIVVLAAGSAVTMDGWHDRTDAILLTWLGGQGVGAATAAVIFGRADPSGRLGETYPLALEDTPGCRDFPGVGGRAIYAEGVFIGYRWYDHRNLPVRYPFGHGLSYTSFGYSDAEVVASTPETVELRVRVTNAGSRHGAEVVQVYIEPPHSADRPERELRAFEKVWLDSGESRLLAFTLHHRDFAFVDATARSWRQVSGTYRVCFGSSSRAVRATVAVDRPDATRPFRDDAGAGSTTAGRGRVPAVGHGGGPDASRAPDAV